MNQGIVRFTSPNGMRVGVETDYGYTVFDFDDGQALPNDRLSGALDDHGDQVVTNLTTGQTLHVRVEAVEASREAALKLCRRSTHS